uniref:Uncharacterized protein n=1 Tax=Arundo donax TaxID=35708 RepID=A0A0A9GHH2_ARUDO
MRAGPTDPSPVPTRSMLKRLFDRQLLRISPAELLPSALRVPGRHGAQLLGGQLWHGRREGGPRRAVLQLPPRRR